MQDQIIKQIQSAIIYQEMTVSELARRSGVHRSTLHRWFSGETHPTMSAVDRVCKALGVRASVHVE